MRRRCSRASPLLWVMVLLAGTVAAACNGSQAASGSDPVPTVPAISASATAVAARATPARTASPTPTATPFSAFDPDLHRPVSKEYALPADYEPVDLVSLPLEWAVPELAAPVVRRVVAAPLVTLLRAARADGLEIRVRSSYRSYATQQATFQFWVDQLGEEQARRQSAEPGRSEHQLGTTVDFASASIGWELLPEFADRREGQWLAARAWQYGFAMSYPRDGEAITGYVFEPWHFRYIGRAAAAGWRQSGLTLIEYLLAMHGDSAPLPDATAEPTVRPSRATVTPSTASPTAVATPTP
ncbi:MAG: M15 family metallopeptidase [Dehalococcoidia bacterium]